MQPCVGHAVDIESYMTQVAFTSQAMCTQLAHGAVSLALLVPVRTHQVVHLRMQFLLLYC